ncbi:hypothetical protein EDB86DRAFT_1044555 [Lactarius hatsudake]|nr:hypothetical protein EDB86DRAFT_1044555 [Lactarius hatsudake]
MHHELKYKSFFSFFLSTTSDIAQFAIPRYMDRSDRILHKRLNPSLPFIHLGFDHLMHDRKIFDQYKTIEDVTSTECIVHMAVRNLAYFNLGIGSGLPQTRPPNNHMCNLPHPSNSVARRSDFVCSFPSPNEIGKPIFSSPGKIVLTGNLISADKPLSCDSFNDPSCLQQLYDTPSKRVSQSCLPSRAFFSNFLIRLTLGICKSEQPRPKSLTSLLSIIQFVVIFHLDLSLTHTFNNEETHRPRCEYSTVSFHRRHITKTDAVLKSLEVRYTFVVALGMLTFIHLRWRTSTSRAARVHPHRSSLIPLSSKAVHCLRGSRRPAPEDSSSHLASVFHVHKP